MYKVLLVNGPYLNLGSNLKYEIYGDISINEIEKKVSSVLANQKICFETFHSNSEDDIINWLKKNREADFLLLNPGALTKTSLRLREVVLEINIPFLEVHLTNIYNSNESEFSSCFSDISKGVLIGLGLKGFTLASKFVVEYLDQKGKN